MVKKKQLNKFLHKRWNAIACSMNNICVETDKETLRQIRVNAKKIKALAQLLKACSKHNHSFSVKPLKDLFHHIGEIRTAQLNAAMVKEYELQSNGFEKEQDAIIQKESKVLCEKQKSYKQNIKKLERRFERKLSKIKDNDIIDYYSNNLQTLSFNFIPPIDPDILHDSRKVIKNLLFPLKVLPTPLVKKLNLNETYLDNLQDLIGQWHDAEVMLQLLSNKNSRNIDAEHNALEIRKNKLFDAIQHLTHSFGKKVHHQELDEKVISQ